MSKKLLSMATGVLALLGLSISSVSAAPAVQDSGLALSKITSETPVVLERPAVFAAGENGELVAWHYSHQSHSSHSSHVSHQSHYSSRY